MRRAAGEGAVGHRAGAVGHRSGAVDRVRDRIRWFGALRDGRKGMRAAAPMLALLLVAGPAACRPDPATPRGAAEIFLDAYYVHIDLAAARDATSGVARQKIEHELELVEGQHIDAGTRKPSVHYRLLEERPDGDQAVSYVYRGTISVEDADRFERRWLVTVRREDGRWRVTNFQETGG